MTENHLNSGENNENAAASEPKAKPAPVKTKKKLEWIGYAAMILSVTLVVLFFCFFWCSWHRPMTVIYDENGTTVYEYYFGRSIIKYKTEYDKNGRMIKKTHNDDEGMLLSYSEYTYNDDGVLTLEREYDWGELSGIKEYDADGLAVRKVIYHSDKPEGFIEYEYDSDGRVVREYEFDETGKPKGRRDYEYEEGADRRRWDYYDSSGKLIGSSDFYSL